MISATTTAILGVTWLGFALAFRRQYNQSWSACLTLGALLTAFCTLVLAGLNVVLPWLWFLQ